MLGGRSRGGSGHRRGSGGQGRGGLQGKSGNRQMLWAVPEAHREGSAESHRASRATRVNTAPCQRSRS